ncbi:hypothetical protein ACFV4K_13785 [Nocardia sp. NPDC059764]|uniref:TY-Chap domain-containing protein n=1 Tax=Nocardia sp. NPDC059764 TaxID=3346939 RepID=UPI00364F43A5
MNSEVESIPAEWSKLSEALPRVLARLPLGGNIVLSTSGNRYVQFIQFETELQSEISCNDFLEVGYRLSAEEEYKLESRGWTAPDVGLGYENWTKLLVWPSHFDAYVELSHAVVFALNNVLNVRSPSDLRIRTWVNGDSGEVIDCRALGISHG